ncbi:MAG: ribonuclease III [Patescibacteria group bacterium]
MRDFSKLEKRINVIFKNQDLLRQALVHRSYLNENPGFSLPHNERLEFLGDAVLELVVTEHLYNNYPNPEGELTNWRAALVNANFLGEIANVLSLGDYLYLSRGEAKDSGSKARLYILANAMEAVIGAIYLDAGWEQASKFIGENILVHLPEVLAKALYLDPKSRFQELAQEKVGVTPRYEVLSETGPDHAKIFRVGLYLVDELVSEGTGSSKQEAQVAAAVEGLKAKDWK